MKFKNIFYFFFYNHSECEFDLGGREMFLGNEYALMKETLTLLFGMVNLFSVLGRIICMLQCTFLKTVVDILI